RREEDLRLGGNRLQHPGVQRRVGLDESFDDRFQGAEQVPLGLVQCLQHGRLGQVDIRCSLDQSGQVLADTSVVLDQAGNDRAQVIERQLADQACDDEHQLVVRFLAVVNDALQQEAE